MDTALKELKKRVEWLTRVRIVLFTGKGGVGKTTIAAATATGLLTAASRRCCRPMLLTRWLTRLAARSAVNRPRSASLWAAQIDTQRRCEVAWRDLQRVLRASLARGGVDAIAAEELTVLPGVEDAWPCSRPGIWRGGQWDAVLSSTVRRPPRRSVLALPEALGWYLQKVFPTRALGPRTCGRWSSRAQRGHPVRWRSFQARSARRRAGVGPAMLADLGADHGAPRPYSEAVVTPRPAARSRPGPVRLRGRPRHRQPSVPGRRGCVPLGLDAVGAARLQVVALAILCRSCRCGRRLPAGRTDRRRTVAGRRERALRRPPAATTRSLRSAERADCRSTPMVRDSVPCECAAAGRRDVGWRRSRRRRPDRHRRPHRRVLDAAERCCAGASRGR